MAEKIDGNYHLVIHKGDAVLFDDNGNFLSETIRENVFTAIYWRYSVDTYLYVGRSNAAPEEFKIGISADPERRAKELGIDVFLTVMLPSRTAALIAEATLARAFKEFSIRKEWYHFTTGSLNYLLRLLKPYSYHWDPTSIAGRELNIYGIVTAKVYYDAILDYKPPCSRCGLNYTYMVLEKFVKDDPEGMYAIFRCPKCDAVEKIGVTEQRSPAG